MIRSITLLACYGILTLILSCSQPEEAKHDLLAESTQLILVTTPGASAAQGTLARFEREADGSWQQIGSSVQTMIGKNGLGQGLGTHPVAEDDDFKREGDGRSPAGVFPLSFVFGFAPPEEMAHLRMDYVHVTETLECVDDGKSAYYNRIVDRDSVQSVDWNSSEKIQAVGEEYHLGVMV